MRMTPGFIKPDSVLICQYNIAGCSILGISNHNYFKNFFFHYLRSIRKRYILINICAPVWWENNCYDYCSDCTYRKENRELSLIVK